MPVYPKQSDARSGDHSTWNGINHQTRIKEPSSIDTEKQKTKKHPKNPHAGSHEDDSRSKQMSSGKREKIPVEPPFEMREKTTMTNKIRLNFLAMLEKKMCNEYGEVFRDIDNIREGRPESFKALETPMDLDTVKYMLEKDLYSTTEAFAGDVRSTFSNALQIFPATHDVHKMASKLSSEFETGFKIIVESADRKQKIRTYNKNEDSDTKEVEKKKFKTAPSSRKRELPATSNGGGEKRSRKEKNEVSVTENPLENASGGKISVDACIKPSEQASKKPCAAMEVSPRRAARTAMLKERFAGLIEKAENTLLVRDSTQCKKDGDDCGGEQRKAEGNESMEKTNEFLEDEEDFKDLGNIPLGPMLGFSSCWTFVDALNWCLNDDFDENGGGGDGEDDEEELGEIPYP